ncbi:hypothetical protein MKX03_032448 [Papaver bracteatum]|nr:hypothetical protein MKX03_032448 [Papaver bracteatum]
MASSSCSANIIFCSIFLCCILAQVVQITAIKLPPNVRVPAVLVFGDSIVDPGNNNHLVSLVKANFSPYGRDFMGGTPSGRFSNGLIPSDLLVKALGIKDLLPAYLDPSLGPNDLLTGVSLASGGAGYDPLLLKYHWRRKKTKSIISESVYLVVAGSDDLANTYFTSQLRSNYDVPAYADLMVQGATNILQSLSVSGTVRYGSEEICGVQRTTNRMRSITENIRRREREKLLETYNQAAQMFNSKLSSSLHNLNANKFVHGRAVYVDIYNPLQEVINRPSHYGTFRGGVKGCCGTGKIETVVLCNDLNPFTCDDPSKYVFWDSYHPTERAYQSLFGPIIKKYFNEFFCGSGTHMLISIRKLKFYPS